MFAILARHSRKLVSTPSCLRIVVSLSRLPQSSSHAPRSRSGDISLKVRRQLSGGKTLAILPTESVDSLTRSFSTVGGLGQLESKALAQEASSESSLLGMVQYRPVLLGFSLNFRSGHLLQKPNGGVHWQRSSNLLVRAEIQQAHPQRLPTDLVRTLLSISQISSRPRI